MDKIIQTELGMVQKIMVDNMRLLYMEVPNDIENQKKLGRNLKSTFLP